MYCLHGSIVPYVLPLVTDLNGWSKVAALSVEVFVIFTLFIHELSVG